MTPGSTRAMRSAASTCQDPVRWRVASTTIASPTVWPASEVPPPRMSSGTPWARATSRAARTSAACLGKTTPCGAIAVRAGVGGVERACDRVEAHLALPGWRGGRVSRASREGDAPRHRERSGAAALRRSARLRPVRRSWGSMPRVSPSALSARSASCPPSATVATTRSKPASSSWRYASTGLQQVAAHQPGPQGRASRRARPCAR